ncbi:hypothetical protein NLK61_24170 [Pseudomonas fuscovaginae UPB0736]|uniref:Phage shock protein B n=1 Tax=Pseudomonas asplenii TaxID=53407 RepID=A0A1H6PCM1_9PSED|nr:MULTISPECIES: hypothetical protein [Pseudomonas]UUQ64282.1 hypothetical protein NLK61_24170 [Pseudomonas fuscovaginae UPB0736]SDT03040.1 hypothetical protein SAMN05216598_3687 [Pseudomonas asplenii]SEI22638.1 hypothetical protein SAMN05216581_4874 [Pseudomonas fuscovaginae]
MKAAIVLSWLACMVLLMAFALYRGRKKATEGAQPRLTDRELLNQATTELQALRAEVRHLGQQIEGRAGR